jgi:acyl-CoA reductase-like NAD-dependent aldehyde dehydrogenase
VLAAAEATFSGSLRADEFSSAGLEKLTPAERVRLDALVRSYQQGTLEAARNEAAAARAAKTAAEERAAKAEAAAKSREKRADEPSLLARAKVLLTPGTEIEYTTVESRIVGEFQGWQRGTTFRLENGQRWQVTDGEEYVHPRMSAPAAKIVPGLLGSFWLVVDGATRKVKVRLVSAAR